MPSARVCTTSGDTRRDVESGGATATTAERHLGMLTLLMDQLPPGPVGSTGFKRLCGAYPLRNATYGPHRWRVIAQIA
jgi:hypothetical protein